MLKDGSQRTGNTDSRVPSGEVPPTTHSSLMCSLMLEAPLLTQPADGFVSFQNVTPNQEAKPSPQQVNFTLM